MMSHYTVCVVTKDGDYEKALEPFDENLEVEPYIEKTKEQIIQEVKNQKASWNKEDSYYKEYFGNVDWSDDNSIFEAYKKANDYHEFDALGNELCTYNPKSKWDWYSLGGRWEGTLKLKDGVKPERESERSWLVMKESKEGYTDFAKAKDIDFTPDAEAKKRAERFWDVAILGKPLKEGEVAESFNTFYNKEYYKKQYGSKKEYIRCQSEFMTYALLYEGVWYEPSEMGWFGCTNANKDDYARYRKFFREVMSKLSPEDYIAVVDCHI